VDALVTAPLDPSERAGSIREALTAGNNPDASPHNKDRQHRHEGCKIRTDMEPGNLGGGHERDHSRGGNRRNHQPKETANAEQQQCLNQELPDQLHAISA
jgi:hypothetical protein